MEITLLFRGHEAMASSDVIYENEHFAQELGCFVDSTQSPFPVI